MDEGDTFSRRRFEALVENLADVITIHDASGVTRYETPSAAGVLGYGPRGLIGRSPFDCIHPKDLAAVRAVFAEILNSAAPSPPVEFRYRHADGRWIWLEAIGRNLIGCADVDGVVLTARDITRRKTAELRLRHYAMHDALTGLPNRLLLQDRLEHALSQARRTGELVAVMFVDLDRFKFVNDTLGHAAGDLLLKEVAARLRAVVREGDTVARFGGDEFMVMLRGLSEPAQASAVAQKILAALEQSFEISGHALYVTASIGTSLFPRDAASEEDLLRLADAAMYRTKEQGGFGHSYAEPGLNERARNTVAVEGAIRRALADGGFALHYQPKIDLATGRLAGVEALLRWAGDNPVAATTARIIEVAEETGTILPLGDWVLGAACRQIGHWRAKGYEVPIAVNVSARQLHQQGLGDRVLELLAESKVPAQCLELEITESALMRDGDRAAGTLRGLRAAGVKVSVDDFGTGYASLNYLRRFPLDTIKIDQSFVRGLADSPDEAAIVQGVIGLAKSLDLKVVGEGVETDRQSHELSRYGCDFGQGFLFSPAVAPAELAGWVDRQWRFERPGLA